VNNTVTSKDMPSGCSFANDKTQGIATFNTMTTGGSDCGTGAESQYYIGAGTTSIGVDMDVQVDVPEK